eukprot:10058811-Alexandrium_andersonii.AAC.1
MFYNRCWSRRVEHGRPDFHEAVPSCPCCRGVGNKIAIWRYQDPNLVARFSADGTQAVRDLLGPEADQPAAARRQHAPS